MSEKGVMPSAEGLVALTEAELDAVSGGMTVAMPFNVAMPFRGITLASFLSSISSFFSETSVSRTSANITVTQSNVSSGSDGTVIQRNVLFV